MSSTGIAAGFTIAGCTALVTGAAGGIGRPLVAELLARGARRVYAATRRDADFDPDPRIVGIRLDVTDPAQVRAAARRCSDTQLLINNAGVNHNQSLLHAPDLAAARAEMEANYFGPLMMCREFAPVLAAAGGGAIINLLSAAALVGMPWMGSLSASKAAALRMTEALRAELAGQRTRMLAALPGAVDTAMTAGVQGIAKLDPREVACAMLDALQAGQDRVLIGDEAQRLERRLQADRDGVLADFARRLQRL